MKIVGKLKVKQRVLTADSVTGDPYDSIEVELDKSSLELTMPRPLFLNKEDKELNFTLQYTSSGTFALFLDKPAAKPTEEDEIEAARLLVLNNRQAESGKTPTERADEVDANSDEFKAALKEVKANNKNTAVSKRTAIAAKLDDDGNPVPDEK